ncbi:MAG: selenium-dependent molybdenum cofactor biosynthesis protein YqeB [Oliverpabstia sp.]
MNNIENLVIVRGGGDIATGTIDRLYQCGFKVLVLEIAAPSAIRRNVAFSEAVYQGEQRVEEVTCFLADNLEDAVTMLNEGKLVMLVDPEGVSIRKLKPMAVVDAILAKKNLGTNKGMADITVALGPGFEAGKDVDAVIETKRGHSLGRVIYQGQAIKNTGIPGMIGGYTKERVIHSPAEGKLKNVKKITDIVKQGDIIARIETNEESIPVKATIDGLLRGLIRDGYPVTKGFKIADIDPRIDEYDNCFTISDKARCIAGGVLEAIMHLYLKKGKKYD